MTQDNFNRLVTVGLFTFFGALYVVSYALNRPIDWQTLLVFIVPTLNNIVHQIAQSQMQLKNIDATSKKDVATIQSVGITNGVTNGH